MSVCKRQTLMNLFDNECKWTKAKTLMIVVDIEYAYMQNTFRVTFLQCHTHSFCTYTILNDCTKFIDKRSSFVQSYISSV